MRDIRRFFNTPPAVPLYHYTGIGSVLGIVKSECVYASHAYYLNDSQELLYGCGQLRTIAHGYLDSLHGSDQQFVRQLILWLDSFNDPRCLFIFSLSEEQNLLSQWRSYTKHGKGVGLAFDPERVRRILAAGKNLKIAKCLYDPSEQTELMSSLLDLCLISFRQQSATIDTSKEHDNQKYFGFLEGFREEFLQVMAIVKHGAFSEEREWRIISPYFDNFTVPEIKFREGAAVLVPYIEIALPRSERDQSLFDATVLGPSKHPNLAMSALAMFMSNNKASSMTINSNTPYREW